MTSCQFKQYCHKLKRKEKSYWNLKQPWKQELDSYKIDQFKSISLSGRIYLLNIPQGRMRILYRRIHNYSSIEENNFLKDRGMFGPYSTSVAPLIVIVVPCSPHIVIIVPHRSQLLLLLCPYIIIDM